MTHLMQLHYRPYAAAASSSDFMSLGSLPGRVGSQAVIRKPFNRSGAMFLRQNFTSPEMFSSHAQFDPQGT